MVKFWEPQTQSEILEIRRLVSRRFPFEYQLLSASFEAADPYEIVYPNNPHEYDDVVLEVLVLLSAEDYELQALPDERLRVLISTAFKRCFGDDPDNQPDASRLDRLIQLLTDRST